MAQIQDEVEQLQEVRRALLGGLVQLKYKLLGTDLYRLLSTLEVLTNGRPVTTFHVPTDRRINSQVEGELMRYIFLFIIFFFLLSEESEEF